MRPIDAATDAWAASGTRPRHTIHRRAISCSRSRIATPSRYMNDLTADAKCFMIGVISISPVSTIVTIGGASGDRHRDRHRVARVRRHRRSSVVISLSLSTSASLFYRDVVPPSLLVIVIDECHRLLASLWGSCLRVPRSLIHDDQYIPSPLRVIIRTEAAVYGFMRD
jgi:hypothetical protein